MRVMELLVGTEFPFLFTILAYARGWGSEASLRLSLTFSIGSFWCRNSGRTALAATF